MDRSPSTGPSAAGAGPLVDVVLPTYGSAPHLDKALRSVIDQSFADWRLTVIDNSPDLPRAAEAVADHAHDPRVRRVATGGLTQAENWNAALASGGAPYVAMIHDDDTWDHSFLARRVRALEEHPDCAFAFSGYRQIDGQDRQTALRTVAVAAGVHEPRDFVPVLFAENVIPVSAVLYRRAALDAVGAAFDERAAYFDYELWLRLSARFPVYHLGVLDNGGRVHEGSITNAHATAPVRRTGEMWLAFLDLVEPMLDEVLPGAVPDRLRRRRRAGALLTCALDDLQAGDRRAATARLRQALAVDRRSVVDPRVPVTLVLALLGPQVLPWLARARNVQHGRQIPVHLGDLRARVRDARRAGGPAAESPG